eukprot:scaffold84_cov163-Amphora_coffeaeformis.AAC.8
MDAKAACPPGPSVHARICCINSVSNASELPYAAFRYCSMVFKSRIRSKRYRPTILGNHGAGKCPFQPGKLAPQTGVAFNSTKDLTKSGRAAAMKVAKCPPTELPTK